MRAGLIVPLLLLAACGGSDLADRDPAGARACNLLGQAFEDKNDTSKAIDGALRAAEAANQSTTPAIRNTVTVLLGTPTANARELREACVLQGVDMPEVP